MKTHVEHTEELIGGVVSQEICRLSVRHHEKLDGSGYPRALTAEQLTQPQRIVAVADIVSALGTRRSYKEPFPKERTLAIIADMQKSQLDYELCQCVIEQYDAIMEQTNTSRNEVINKYLAMQKEFVAS